MPVGPFPTFAACVAELKKKHGEAGARRICGAMEQQSKIVAENKDEGKHPKS